MSTEAKIREAWFRIEPMTHDEMQGFDHFRAGYILGMDEAFETALNACIQAEQESSDAKSQLSDEEYIAKSVAAGAVYQAKKLQGVIREMAKEMK